MSDIRDQIIVGTNRFIGDTLDQLRAAVMDDAKPLTDRDANDMFVRLMRLSKFRREFSSGSPDVDARTMLDVVAYLSNP